MAKINSTSQNQTVANPDSGRFIAQMMAIDEVEHKLIAADPRLRREIWFQAVALVVWPGSFWYVFNTFIEQAGPGANLGPRPPAYQ